MTKSPFEDIEPISVDLETWKALSEESLRDIERMAKWYHRPDEFGAPIVGCSLCKAETHCPMQTTIAQMTEIAIKHHNEVHYKGDNTQDKEKPRD